MKSGVYKITNEVTGKFYIGSAKDIDWRWFEHKRDLRLKSHCNPKLQHSWDFYGEDKFTLSVLEETSSDQNKLFEREQYYLDTFQPYKRGIGYNICPTAQGGDNITHNPNRDAFIEKMSEVCSGENNPMFGRTHSDKTIKEMKLKALGRFTLDWFIEKYGSEMGLKKYEKRRAMLSNRKMNYSYKSSRKGKKLAPMKEQSKQKISETKKRMKNIKPELFIDIISNQCSVSQLSFKYNLNIEVIKYYKRKLKKEGKL